MESSGLAGSEDNALKLIQGLRQGTPLRLDDNPQSTTVTPPSGTGYGNVFIILALSQASLSQAGNTSPTSERLSSTINGVREKRTVSRTDHTPRAAKPERGQRP